jgi:2-polyprenyl-3-methyl-5-hydroxy-6-metoxy-1,4-benzoquinol methylase
VVQEGLGMSKYNEEHLKNATDMTVDFAEIVAPHLGPLFGDLTGKTVLDVGCGTGKYSRFAALFGAKVTAIDKGDLQIRHALEGNKRWNTKIDYLVGDICSIKGLDEKFDVALIMFVVLDTMSLESLQQIIREVARAVKPGGRLILGDIHPHNFGRVNDVESVYPIGNGNYFSEACPIGSKVLMEFRPSYHYPLGTIINSICCEGFLLRRMIEPIYLEAYPTHIILEFIKPEK